MNQMDAVRCFCIAAETLNFRETAHRLAVSPPVITRLINELENTLGEPLFVRNTRRIRLTDFGERFLLKAQLWLDDGMMLFQNDKMQDDMAGVVRITVPVFHAMDSVLAKLLDALSPYPDLVIDWRQDILKLDNVAHGIDIGVRITLQPEPEFIVRQIAEICDRLVAAPSLIERLGAPKDVDDLCRRYPFVLPVNPETGRPWALFLNEDMPLRPHRAILYSPTPYVGLNTALQGKAVDLANEVLYRPHVRAGSLVVLFPEIPVQKWRLFVYRPYQTVAPKRVLTVFDLLTDILKEEFAAT